MKKIRILFILIVLGLQTAQAQDPVEADENGPILIQFSGFILTSSDRGLIPVPWATVFLPGKSRGTYADHRGFFTLVVEKKDKVRFNCIGFDPVTITIPDTLTQDRYSIIQMMTQDTINLPVTEIFPWPSKEPLNCSGAPRLTWPTNTWQKPEKTRKWCLTAVAKAPLFISDSNLASMCIWVRYRL
jgi:hypothetical protein